MTDLERVALAARVFTLAALTSVAALSGPAYLPGALWVGVVAVVAVAVTATTTVPLWAVAALEGACAAVVAVAVHPHSDTVTPYLVIPALIAALDAGRRALVQVVVVEFAMLLVAWAVLEQRWDRMMAVTALTWLLTSVGIGLMGLVVRRPARAGGTDGPYRSAVLLIRRLEALSGRLSGGLDAVSIAEQVMALAEDLAPTRAAGVFVRPDASASIAPLRFSAGTQAGAMPWAEELAARCWEYEAMMLREHHVALPLMANDEMIAVLALDTVATLDTDVALDLRRRLSGHAVQLQAALLFGRVRDTATSQERHRIAREVHDGVAQDVASLGYLVDNLAAGTSDPAQVEQLVVLRKELTRVVTDLRHSIFDLRHEMGSGTGLGESLSAYAHQVGSTSSLRVHVTLDEEGPRLPRDVEQELLRIAQEAMTNVRKHAGADNLWLHCSVRSPYAEIRVRDDGTGPHAPRPDSQGLHIMRERARSVGGHLRIDPPTPHRPGTRVAVRVGDRPASLPDEADPGSEETT
ncbi:MAG: two-component sensor histidine kinase [Marmoricola sp.]|nr:two-component sensor histidine kinase [Marmoricola sp.]